MTSSNLVFKTKYDSTSRVSRNLIFSTGSKILENSSLL